MNERALRPGNVAAGAALIGGILTVAFPQHVVSILQVLIVTVAVSAGLYALAVNVPPTGWISPFKWMSPFNLTDHKRMSGARLNELASIRSKLSGRRWRSEYGPPVPPATLRLLKPLIEASLDLDPDHRAPPASARGLVSPLTWAVLISDAGQRLNWFRTVRSNEAEVAKVVHSVLDDLDRLRAGPNDP